MSTHHNHTYHHNKHLKGSCDLLRKHLTLLKVRGMYTGDRQLVLNDEIVMQGFFQLCSLILTHSDKAILWIIELLSFTAKKSWRPKHVYYS